MLSLLLALFIQDGGIDVGFQGHVWEPIEFGVVTPVETNEAAVDPNPFLDYRMDIVFTSPTNKTRIVSGFYAGDGQGNGVGNVWRVHFMADEAGEWHGKVFFREGPDVNVFLNHTIGDPIEPIDGRMFRFTVLPTNPSARGFYQWGLLETDLNNPYLKFRDGSHWLKGGVNSPENFLGYAGFDDAVDTGGLPAGNFLHHYTPHIEHWQPGDPNWIANTGVDGRGIIGALNYLSRMDVNSIYFMPMNLGGDARDTFPFLGTSGSDFDNTHYDISRMYQWNIVMKHAMTKNIALHFVLNEREEPNREWLDGGTLGTQRKLYYKMLASMFGYHPAVQWNITEENQFPLPDVTMFANYIENVDAYDHPITIHNNKDGFQLYEALKDEPWLNLVSFQFSKNTADQALAKLREIFGNKLAVLSLDEVDPANTGLQPNNAMELRKVVLYDTYFSGGQLEWYMGTNDQNLEDFQTRKDMWKFMRIARFVTEALPFNVMRDMDQLLSGENTQFGGGEVFAEPGDTYAIYYPNASQTGSLNLAGAPGEFTGQWIDPRNGNMNFESFQVQGDQAVTIPPPPQQPGEDWVLVISR